MTTATPSTSAGSLASHSATGVPVENIDDGDGNHTDRLAVTIGDTQITIVVPPPPDEWSLTE